MENHLLRADRKLSMLFEHATVGFAEIDRKGQILALNPKGKALLKPVRMARGFSENNLFPILEYIAPEVAERIKSSPDEAGKIIINALQSFSYAFDGEKVESHFQFSVNKMFTDCIILSFDDITQRHQQELSIRDLRSDNAVTEGKYEIASNVLHDIGNAMVGFGSYIIHIKRSLEQDNYEKLQKMTEFFTAHQSGMTSLFGADKAGAIISMLTGITVSQKNSEAEILKAVEDQLNIITHIQEILQIQRQYSNGNQSQKKIPVNLRLVINDCISMLFAAIEKRQIRVSINFPNSLPVFYADRTRLMQVILNILKNSMEAIDINANEKNIFIDVTSHDNTLILKIRDNGQGFEKAKASHLFERGFTTKNSGSGIGLSSCRSIIESQNGSIDILSEGPGKGALTTVKFKI